MDNEIIFHLSALREDLNNLFENFIERLTQDQQKVIKFRKKVKNILGYGVTLLFYQDISGNSTQILASKLINKRFIVERAVVFFGTTNNKLKIKITISDNDDITKDDGLNILSPYSQSEVIVGSDTTIGIVNFMLDEFENKYIKVIAKNEDTNIQTANVLVGLRIFPSL